MKQQHLWVNTTEFWVDFVPRWNTHYMTMHCWLGYVTDPMTIMLFSIFWKKNPHIRSLCELITWYFLTDSCDASIKLNLTALQHSCTVEMHCTCVQFYITGEVRATVPHPSLPKRSLSTVLQATWAWLFYHHCLCERFLLTDTSFDFRDTMHTGTKAYVLEKHEKDIFSWYYKLNEIL